MIKKLMILCVVASLMLITVACGGGNATNGSNNQTPAPNNNQSHSTPDKKSELEGRVVIDGSGTVYPLMAHIAEEYMTNVQPNVSVEVGRAGSSAGFKKFIPGELDFADASRPVKKEEAEQLATNGWNLGTEVLEFKIALDGLTMVINKDNTWATEMTKEEIVNMYITGSHKVDDKVLWSDIRSGWPTDEVKFYGPNENHGTYEFFWEVILGKKDLVKTANLQQEYSTLVDLVSKDKNAIAFFGYGYYVSNKDKLQAVKVDFGNGSVEPTVETIGEDLPYAGFTRPVFTYLSVPYAKEKPQVLDYAKYVVTEGAPKLAGLNGFAPLPDAVYAEYLNQLNAIK
jgi:phosphate transport system substrate-binding protein